MGAVVVLFGLVFAAAGGFVFYRGHRLVRAGQRAEADVVDLHWSHHSEVYYPVVAFRTADGRAVEARTTAGRNPPAARVGQRVRVIYDPGAPHVVMIDSFDGRGTLVAAVFVLVGVGLIALRIAGLIH